MADGLAPHIAKVLGLPPPVLVDDRSLTTSSARRSKSAKRSFGTYGETAGFPRAKPAAIEKNASSPVKDLKNVAGVETFTIRMEAGQENTTHHFLPKRKNGRLVVLQHGHACTFDDAQDPRAPAWRTRSTRSLGERLCSARGLHAAHAPRRLPDSSACTDVRSGDQQSGSPLKFFLEPVAISLNALSERYKEIHMVGLSGGGWTTTLYAAVDPRIRYSFPVAGTIPLYLRTGGSVGDKEQYLEEFYRLAGYPDLYLLGASGPAASRFRF